MKHDQLISVHPFLHHLAGAGVDLLTLAPGIALCPHADGGNTLIVEGEPRRPTEAEERELRRIARRLKCSVLFVAHLRERGGRHFEYRCAPDDWAMPECLRVATVDTPTGLGVYSSRGAELRALQASPNQPA